MIAGIILYWVWVLLALILDYVIMNCVYLCNYDGERTDEQATYPMWAWLVFCLYPFVPVINFGGFIFLFIMMFTAEQKKNIWLKGKFFEDVKPNKKQSESEE